MKKQLGSGDRASGPTRAHRRAGRAYHVIEMPDGAGGMPSSETVVSRREVDRRPDLVELDRDHAGLTAADQAQRLKRDDIGMHGAYIPIQRPCQGLMLAAGASCSLRSNS